MSVAWLDSPAFDAHDEGRGHPERPERLRAIREGLSRLESRLVRPAPRPATTAELSAVHDARYVEALRQRCAAGGGQLDPDTRVVPASWDAALLAAGAAVEATLGVLEGRFGRAFCSVRPPGHHARPDRAMGFCLFDNIAVAAQAAIDRGLVRKVAILDFDVHHGNGTQEIFWRRGDVLYASTHEFPFYPGSGDADEIGEAEGLGKTVNCPLPMGAGDAELLAAWQERIRPAFVEHGPDLVLVSAGFDADARDPLGQLEVTAAGFAELSQQVVRFADEHCQGRVVSVLEGGYDLGALREDVALHVETML